MAKTQNKSKKKTNKKAKTRTKTRGGVTGKGFDVSGQPSPEAKKRGWAKKKAKDAIVQAFDDFALLTYEQLRKIAKGFDKNKYEWPNGEKLTVTEVKALKYLMNNNLDMDFMNRGISYAKQEHDITTNGNPISFGFDKIINDNKNTKDVSKAN